MEYGERIMSKYKIISDSSSDIKDISDVAFSSVPLKISTAEKEFCDDKSLDLNEMLTYLEKYKGRSGSACPNTSEWLEAFENYENIFCIAITSSLSGSYNSAVSAAKEYTEMHKDRNVLVIDSLSTGPECALIIEKLKELITAGKAFDEISKEITEYRKHTHLLFALESMHNLANNGRVSPIVAKLAGVLGIRIVGKASDVGTLEIINKSRGAKKMLEDIVDNMKKMECSGKVFIHHCENESTAKKIEELVKENFINTTVKISPVGGLCGFYAERGGILIGFEGE